MKEKKFSYLLLILAFIGISLSVKAQSLKDKIQPAIKNAGFKMPGYILWCPSVIKVGNIYHMFASRWPEKYGLAGWTTHSEVVRATSNNLYGPYTFQEVVIQKRDGFWDNDRAHNPKITKVGDKFVLYYISSANETGYAWADAITGPWHRIDAPAMNFSNPAPLVMPDQSIYVFGRKAIGKIRIAQGYKAAAFDSTYVLLKNGENLLPGLNQLEDPTIWWCNQQYHVILSDFNGDATGIKKAGAEYVSPDGLKYILVSKEPVYTKVVQYEDHSSQTFRRRERPFVYPDQEGNILALFTACLTQDSTGHEQSWIVVNPVDHYHAEKFISK